MKSFSHFIAENRMTTLGELTAAIAQHKKAGEILNPVYKDLTDQARRILGADMKHVRDMILKHIHAGDKTEELNDLYYDWPSDSFASLNKASKTLTKIKDPKFKDVVTAGKAVLDKWIPVGNDLKDLKGKVVKITQKRAEAKAEAEKVKTKKMGDYKALIKILESHIEEYKDMARKEAKKFIEDRLNFLKKHDWDLDKAVPHTKNYNDYKAVEQKRSFYRSITKAKETRTRPSDPDIRIPNQEMINHYIDMNVKGAEDSYHEFIGKMIQKIGKPVVKADMRGNIWTNATLIVTTDDGEEQVWNTKMILNFSKYQKMFNQFPTRRKK